MKIVPLFLKAPRADQGLGSHGTADRTVLRHVRCGSLRHGLHRRQAITSHTADCRSRSSLAGMWCSTFPLWLTRSWPSISPRACGSSAAAS
jgi:hypothetical protein